MLDLASLLGHLTFLLGSASLTMAVQPASMMEWNFTFLVSTAWFANPEYGVSTSLVVFVPAQTRTSGPQARDAISK